MEVSRKGSRLGVVVIAAFALAALAVVPWGAHGISFSLVS